MPSRTTPRQPIPHRELPGVTSNGEPVIGHGTDGGAVIYNPDGTFNRAAVESDFSDVNFGDAAASLKPAAK